MNNYIYADDAAPVLPKGHHHSRDRVARQHQRPIRTIRTRTNGSDWGDRTVDEMAHAWVNVTYISDEDYKEWAAQHKKRPASPYGALAGSNN